jgi:hypothetical protein
LNSILNGKKPANILTTSRKTLDTGTIDNDMEIKEAPQGAEVNRTALSIKHKAE